MKIFKQIAVGIIIIVSIPLLVALFLPKDYSFEKTITIMAPIDTVWNNTNSFEALDKWNPWNYEDPTMKKQITGMDGAVGSKQTWESENYGYGHHTISKIEKPYFFETELIIDGYYTISGKTYVILTPEAENTLATWGITETIPYPYNLLQLFTKSEEGVEKYWEVGLLRLKSLSEGK